MEPEQRVYWEKQLYALCGVHCLNTLLQGPFFDQGKLATIALELDAKEKQLMEAEGTTTMQFLMYMAEDSYNVAEDGNYSIQVLEQALKKIGQGINIVSENVNTTSDQYIKESGFIVHLGAHWFSIRKINGEFYNFNSLYNMPEVVPDEILPIFLTNLKNQGCQIWIVKGEYPPVQEQMYKNLNDNQMLVSVQKIHDYTEEKIIENMMNVSSGNYAASAAGLGPAGPAQPAGPAIDGFHQKYHYQGEDDYLMKKKHQNSSIKHTSALPHSIPKKQPKYIDGVISPPIQQYSKSNYPSASPSPSPSLPVLKKAQPNYDKFHLADPTQNLYFFNQIRQQIMQNFPEQPQNGITVHFTINDSQQLSRKFSTLAKVQLLYDYIFIILTSKPLKKKIKFQLQLVQNMQVLLDMSFPIKYLTDQNFIRLKVKIY